MSAKERTTELKRDDPLACLERGLGKPPIESELEPVDEVEGFTLSNMHASPSELMQGPGSILRADSSQPAVPQEGAATKQEANEG